MLAITNGTSKYSDEQRINAAIEYAVSGNLERVSKQVSIPRRTMQDWTKTDWFIDIVTEVRLEKSQEHRAKYSQIVDKAQAVTLKKLPKATAAQANLIACQATDKIRLADNLPTSISGKAESMTELAKRFQELSEQVEKDRSVVSVQDGKQTG